MTIEVIGATCIIKWLSDGGTEQVYISFGNYDEDTETDGFGVPDCVIFGYSDDVDGIAEAYSHEFVVLDVELEVREAIATDETRSYGNV